MNAGQLRHRVSVDKYVVTQNDTGEEVVTFEQVDTVWGKVEPLTGREVLQANAVTGDMDTRITIRWSPEVDQINPKWRLRFRDIIYDIKSVAHKDMARREIEIMARSGLNAG